MKMPRVIRTAEWQEQCGLAVGVWLFLSPWMLRFFEWGEMSTMNFLVMGMVIVAVAMAALYMHTHAFWEGVILALGLWLVVSPQVIGFADNYLASANAALAGIFLMGLGLSELNRDLHKTRNNDDKSATAH